MPFTALAGHRYAYRNRANATDANRPCCTDDGHSEAPLEDEIDECTCTAWSRVPWKDCHDAAPEAEDRGSETANELEIPGGQGTQEPCPSWVLMACDRRRGEFGRKETRVSDGWLWLDDLA